MGQLLTFPGLNEEEERSYVERQEAVELEQFLIKFRFPIVRLTGPYGSGKTTLARHFLFQRQTEFRNDISWLSAGSAGIEDLVGQFGRLTQSLLVIDDCELDPLGMRRLLNGELPVSEAQLLLIGRASGIDHSIHRNDVADIQMGELSRSDAIELFRRSGFSEDFLGEIHEFSAGNPRLALSLLNEVRRNGSAGFLRSLHRFDRPGLVDHLGRPLSVNSEAGAKLYSDARAIDRSLLMEVGRKPELVFDIDPRRFEELSAELFRELGYEVELTPASGDGGRDLHVAKKDSLGALLFYVECKRYAPHRPIGVGLVRQLHGTVQADKATAGILLTTSRFTKGAKAFESKVRHQLSLADYSKFQSWLSQAGFKSG